LKRKAGPARSRDPRDSERLGFTRDRKIGKHRWVVTKVVEVNL